MHDFTMELSAPAVSRTTREHLARWCLATALCTLVVAPGIARGQSAATPSSAPEPSVLDVSTSPRTARYPVYDGGVQPRPEPSEASSDDDAAERRDTPNYDGRVDPREGARGLLWVPRTILAPAYVVNEYILRRPLGALVTWLEREKVPQKVSDVLSFGTGGRIGLYPTALVDFGLRPSIGLYFFANDVPTDDDKLRLAFAWGGNNWWNVELHQRFHLAGAADQANLQYNASRLNLHFEFLRRPDYIFYGLGTIAENAPGGAYQESRLRGAADIEVNFGELDGLTFGVATGRYRFADGDGDVGKAEDELSDFFDLDDESALPGFRGYAFGELYGSIRLDSRPADTRVPGHGAVIEAFGELGLSLDTDRYGWGNYGARGSLHWEPGGRGRELSVHHQIAFSDPIGGGRLPFNKHTSLNELRYMRGFVDERFRGRSTIATMLQYRYPVWAFVDGYLWYSIGNSFGEYLDGLEFADLASSFGVGMRSNGDRDGGVTLLVGFGMEPFGAEGYRLDSVRVVVGFQGGL